MISIQTIQALQTALTVDGRDYIQMTLKQNLRNAVNGQERNVTMTLETERRNDTLMDEQDDSNVLDKNGSDDRRSR